MQALHQNLAERVAGLDNSEACLPTLAASVQLCQAVCAKALARLQTSELKLGTESLSDRLRDCFELCGATASLLTRCSPYSGVTCALCASVCDACARACADSSEFQFVVTACGRCATDCRASLAALRARGYSVL